MNGFSFHFVPDKKYKKEKLTLFGNFMSIYGTEEDDYNSCDSIQMVMEAKMPDALIMGDVSYADMDYFR